MSGDGLAGGRGINAQCTGGGAGAGAPGVSGSTGGSFWHAGAGGDGRLSTFTGRAVWYAGGGAGGSSEWYAGGGGSEKTADGGKGGGGASRLAPNVRVSEAGVDTLGGGGAGAGCSTSTDSVNYQAGTPGCGGNGVVVIRVTKVTGGGDIKIGLGGTSAAYESQAAAEADLSKAVFVPSAEVAEMFAEDSAALAAYKAEFGFAVVPTADGKWVIKAEILPGPRTKLVESAQSATRQIPLAEIAALELGVPIATSVENCEPGFYYSLYEGTEVINLKASQSDAHRNVLCGTDGTVVFPSVVKPSLEKGFFSVGVLELPTVDTGAEYRTMGAFGNLVR